MLQHRTQARSRDPRRARCKDPKQEHRGHVSAPVGRAGNPRVSLQPPNQCRFCQSARRGSTRQGREGSTRGLARVGSGTRSRSRSKYERPRRREEPRPALASRSPAEGPEGQVGGSLARGGSCARQSLSNGGDSDCAEGVGRHSGCGGRGGGRGTNSQSRGADGPTMGVMDNQGRGAVCSRGGIVRPCIPSKLKAMDVVNEAMPGSEPKADAAAKEAESGNSSYKLDSRSQSPVPGQPRTPTQRQLPTAMLSESARVQEGSRVTHHHLDKTVVDPTI